SPAGPEAPARPCRPPPVWPPPKDPSSRPRPGCSRAPRPKALRSGGVRLVSVTGLGGKEPGADLPFDLARDFLVLLQEVAAGALVGVPGAGLLDDALADAEVDDLAFAGDARAVHDLELRLAEGRGHLVLHDLDTGHVADDFLAALDGADAAYVEPHGGVELERVAAGGGLRVAEHHAELHADLVDEDDDGVRALDVAGELAQRLRHETRLQADLHLAHLALDFRARGECGDG